MWMHRLTQLLCQMMLLRFLRCPILPPECGQLESTPSGKNQRSHAAAKLETVSSQLQSLDHVPSLYDKLQAIGLQQQEDGWEKDNELPR
jgi:hypothetical protein